MSDEELGRATNDLESDFARLLGDERAADAAKDRVRERHLRESAAADATFLGTALDMAEQGTVVTVTTRTGRSVSGQIGLVATDTLVIGSTYLPLWAVAAIRRAPGMRSGPADGDRNAPRVSSFAVLIAELALLRPRVSVAVTGEPALLAGELRAAGTDVITLRLDGEPPVVAYVSLASVSALTVLASG
ncbi:MAG: hypothetical protein NVS3B21_06710 [Acidimicrobiales bacterium]